MSLSKANAVRSGALLLCLLAALPGCAAWRPAKPTPEEIAAKREGRKVEAIKHFNESRQEAQFKAAVALWNQGDIEGFQRALEELLQANPEHTQASLMLAELYFLHDETEQARQVLEAVIEKNPSQAQAQHLMGLVLERLGDTQRSALCFQKAAELDPKNFKPTADSQVQLASYAAPITSTPPLKPSVPALTLPQTVPADACIGRQTSPEVRACLQQADAALRNQALPEARDALNRAITAANHSEQATLAVGVLSLQYNQTAWAVEFLTPAVRAYPNSAALFRTLGTAHYRSGDYPAAEVALRQALSLDNASALSYFLLGCTLDRLGQTEAALWHHRQAQALDPAYDPLQ